MSYDFVSSSQGKDNKTDLAIAGSTHRYPHCVFEFQKTTYCYWQPDAPADAFVRLHYPIHGKVKDLLSSKGYSKEDEVDMARSIWGPNIFDIPLPAFADLFKVRRSH